MTPFIGAPVPATAQPVLHDVFAVTNVAATFIVFVIIYTVIRLRRERDRVIRRAMIIGLIGAMVALGTAVANAVLTFTT
jgi:cytochrome bd-type quinol oxidase subunit 1